MAKKSKLTQPKWGEVYLVSFNPITGAEIQKTRPALILQNDIANEHSPIIKEKLKKLIARIFLKALELEQSNK